MRRAWLFLIFSVLILLPGRGFVFSQEAKKGEPSSSEEILYKGEMKSVGVNVPKRVIIGKPDIADIYSVNTKEIVLVGKASGSTTLIWWDQGGEHMSRIKVMVEDMRDINARISNLIKELDLPSVSTEGSDSEGKVLLLGSVKTGEDMERIRTALGGLFSRTTNLIQVEEEKAIIELEVEVIEVDKGSTRDLGMDWLGSGGSVLLNEAGNVGKTLAEVPKSLMRVTDWTHDTMTATLNLLVSEGKARILSRPKLACQSGKEASLLIGAEQPIMTTSVTGTTGAASTSVEYKEYGIKLKMSPTLNYDGKIKLLLNVEVSDIGETAETLGSEGSPTAKAWPFTKRTTATQLYLKNNQTLAISGLIKQKTTEDLKKFPWLGEVPVLGVFFRSKTIKKGGGSLGKTDTELVIMVTPTVVEYNKPSPQEVGKKSTVKAEPEGPSGSQAGSAKAGLTPASGQQKITKNQTGEGAVSNAGAPATTANKGIVSGAKASSAGKAASQKTEPALAPDNKEDLPRTPTEEYINQVTEYLSNNIPYPWAARQAELEGTVTLNLHLAKSGDLLESNVGDSSGYSVLDENATRIARQITPYPSFPRGINEQDLWIQIPVVYRVKQQK
jgi:pilus assembly protein CpaC